MMDFSRERPFPMVPDGSVSARRNGDVLCPCSHGDARSEPALRKRLPLDVCYSVAPCITSCWGDVECMRECGHYHESPALEAFTAIMDCEEAQCAECNFFTAWPLCNIDSMQTECRDLHEACFISGEGLTCPEVKECGSACGADDVPCASFCLVAGTRNAQEAYLKVATCVHEHCGFAGDVTCRAEVTQARGACYEDVLGCLDN